MNIEGTIVTMGNSLILEPGKNELKVTSLIIICDNKGRETKNKTFKKRVNCFNNSIFVLL